jgi:hypothetical protein
LVKHRYGVSPASEFYTLTGEKIGRLVELTKIMRLSMEMNQ